MNEHFDFKSIDVRTLNPKTVESAYHQIKSNVYLLGAFLQKSTDTTIHLPNYLNELTLNVGQKTKEFQQTLELNEYINKEELIDISTTLLGFSQSIRNHVDSVRPKENLSKEIATTYKVLDIFEEKIYSVFMPKETINPYTSVETMLDYLHSPLRQEKLGCDASIRLENTNTLIHVPEQDVKIVLDNVVNNIYDYSSGFATISGQIQENFYSLSLINNIIDESALAKNVKTKRTGIGLKENKELLECYGGTFMATKQETKNTKENDLFIVHAFFPLYKETSAQQK